MKRSLPVWLKRTAAIGLVVIVLATAAFSWVLSNLVRSDVLTPQVWSPEADLEIVAVGGGRIVLTRTDLTEQEGVWGLVGEDGYGQVSSIVEVRDDVVERSFRPLEGTFQEGTMAAFDQYAFTGDPQTSHGISFRDVRVPGVGGSYPAWQIDGDRDTWIIFVHGKGLDERKQSLRILPTLVDEGFPVLVISYRNDTGAPSSESGLYRWGLDEWAEVESALEFAQAKGAESFVIMGYSMGGAVTSMFLHESTMAPLVKGVIFDSPVLDLEEVVDSGAGDRHIPGVLTSLAEGLVRIRFGIEWSELDQVARAAEFDPALPILLMHGSEDATVPVKSSDAFAAARPDIVTYERFEGADHVYLWNTNPTRYEAAVIDFLGRVAPPS